MSKAAAPIEQIKLTVDEMSDSLTGFEEDEILTHFGADFYTLAAPRADGGRYIKALRGLVFVAERRNEVDASTAVKTAMGMRSTDVLAFFADDPEEIDDEEPETPVGKDDSLSGTEPETSPSGAS